MLRAGSGGSCGVSQSSVRVRTPFSASEAAFAGFGILQRRPSALLVWGGLMLVVGLISNVGMVLTIGPQMQALRAASAGAGATPNPAAVGALFVGMAPFYLLAMIGSILLLGVINAAVNRAVLRPNEGGPGYLAFGADEFLQIVVIFLWALLLIAFYLVLVIVFGLVIGLGVGAAAAGGGGRGGPALFAGLFVLIGVLATFAGVIWLNVRLSFALPLTFDTRKLHLFGSFALTRGRFWPLFGAYLLSWIFAIIITLVFLAVIAALGAAVGGGLAGIGQLFQRDTSSLGAFLTPVSLISLVLGSFVQALQWALISGAQAGAYAQLKPDRYAEVF